MKLMDIDVEVGTRWEVGGLTVFPLTSVQSGTVAFLTGPEAFESGLIEIDELDPPEVPLLAVVNLADVPILLVEGEMLVGGDQNRTMNVTVLSPARSRTIVPVSCVEAGRWGDETRRVMASARRHAPGSLRAAKTANLESRVDENPERHSDQGQVWEAVDRQSLAHGVESETFALDDVQTELESRIASQLDEVRALPNQIGVVCAIGTQVVGLDVFDRPSTLDHYLRAIVAGHALDVPARASSTDPQMSIERFLAQVGATRCDPGRAVGLGEEVRLRGEVAGVGLTYDDRLIHLAAFPVPA